ncbi:hypothetical protein PLICRDRAFT_173354 [Plicaturopsis crispa FD-325 SS-3]|nr:hypothetical protein PLICRDRAFT_173354 [Plicaturopsis crispa FD-325 SS-3]
MPITLLSLPPELLVRIISLSTVIDTFTWQLTTRYLRDLVKGSSELQYRIAAYAAGVIDNPKSRLSHAERLERLKAREAAWSTLHVRGQTTIAMNYMPSGIYDLTRGVYFQGEEGPLGLDGPQNLNLNYVVLPDSLSAEGQPLSWLKMHSDHHIIDLGLCLQEHGLVALVVRRPGHAGTNVIEITLREFATGRPHPAAAQPTLHICTVPEILVRCSVSLEIVGDYLALLLIFPQARAIGAFHLYNWKTGRSIRKKHTSRGSYSSLAFLAHDLILVTNMADARIEIFRVRERLRALDPVLFLELPQVHEAGSIFRFTCRAEPNPVGCMSSPISANRADDERPFFSSPDDAILFFGILLLAHDNTFVDKCVFFVHRRALLALVPSPAESLASPPKVLTWDNWGPGITRWFEGDNMPTRWITVTAGQRYALIPDTAYMSPAPIKVLDFNPYSCWRQKQAEEAGTAEAGTRLLDETSTLEVSRGFAGPVNSRLPYVETLASVPYSYDAVLMDEARILGLRLSNDDRSTITSIDVLLMG